MVRTDQSVRMGGSGLAGGGDGMGRRRSGAGVGPEDRAALLRALASCPECGLLCMVWRAGAGFAELMDLSDWNELAARAVLGDGQVDRQGVGINRGWFHVCPPTRAALLDESGKELVREVVVR